MGRILAIGDIHGCDTALETVLGQLQICSEDTLVVLGDIVDRGPGTRRVIDRLIDLQSECSLYFIMGNHEEMMLNVLDGELEPRPWLNFGGQEVVDAYGGELANIPDKHIQFLRSALDYHATTTDVFVHGSLEPNVPLNGQIPKWLRWTRYTGRESPLETGQRVICGHTAQKDGLPARSRGWVCLDTYAYGGGWLTVLDTMTDEFFQADQNGRYRTGQL